MKASTEGRYPLDCAAGSATNVEARSSNRNGSTAGCTLNVPGFQALNLLLDEYLGP